MSTADPVQPEPKPSSQSQHRTTNMTQVIIYKTDEGGIAIVRPTEDCLQEHTIQEIAIKDVPAGKPFKIVDASDIPSDRSQRDAWTVDEADLTDNVGGVSNEFEVQE